MLLLFTVGAGVLALLMLVALERRKPIELTRLQVLRKLKIK